MAHSAPPEQKLKILYLITKSNFGGAQRYVFDLATSMHALGHDVVVGFGGNGLLAEKLQAAGIRTVSIEGLERDVHLTDDVRTFFRLLDLFADENPDIIHLNSSKMGGLGAVAARLWNGVVHVEQMTTGYRRSARIIFTGHGWAFNEDRSDFSRFVIGIAHWVTIALSHETIAVSQRTREQVISLPLVWHKVSVVHNGVGTFSPKRRADAQKALFGDRQEELLAHDPIVIGTIAELHKNKGLSYALEGIAQLKKQSTKPFLYVIIGDGEERLALEHLATTLDINDVVSFAGYKPDASTLLAAFDIFLLPSITEAFPYVILEAGNVGLPVVATAVGGIPEVIDDMHSGILIQTKNPGEVTRALGHLLDTPERRAEFGAAIKERITGRFGLATMVTETLRVYTPPAPPKKETAESEEVVADPTPTPETQKED
jgi:glycosyltransferase involved in cell wall biosynthesis